MYFTFGSPPFVYKPCEAAQRIARAGCPRLVFLAINNRGVSTTRVPSD